MYIKLDDIIPNRFQPREIFDEESLEKLADSIKNHGVIEPIIVRPVSNKFEIIAGERRYKASVLAGLTKIPAIVKQMDDKESSIVAYIENEHRSGVSAIEEARTIERILKTNNMKQDELAKELGINQSTIANKIRLLNLPIEVQDALMHNEISERHARSLLSVKEPEKQIELLNKIKEKKMTVRELDGEIKNMYNSINDDINNNKNTYENTAITNDQNMVNENSNNYTHPIVNEEPIPTESSYFMNFLSNYNNDNPLPQTYPRQTQEIKPLPSDNQILTENSINSQVETNNETIESSQVDQKESSNESFLSFLNNYDLNHPIEKEENISQPVETIDTNVSSNSINDSFLGFLNNYDKNNQINKPIVSESVPKETQEIIEDNPQINQNYNESVSNVILNDVTPPVTNGMNPNQYVEDNPNYVDLSQNVTIDNVDEIIDRLKAVVDDIKATSNLKIDTDEINFDDIYQITIKIDKRNF